MAYGDTVIWVELDGESQEARDKHAEQVEHNLVAQGFRYFARDYNQEHWVNDAGEYAVCVG